ncbi:porphobilinogen deaminase [Polychaeton citri CBS 116435]|uniref:Porphobilinogen deaminase n=1 Tax=Polychaeton citri CBS 116435 TaxID=1314669 RepID=A0A9P4UTZ4_9PEZI|nr:porphobilinogen deaminase [Polychaeton citri CBS 116435]
MSAIEDVKPNAVAPPTTQQTFRIGTRRSMLARVQADEVAKSLREAWPEHKFEIHAMATAGDNNQTTALHKFNDKALWTQDLEVLLQKGELDLIVHCLKDMPTQLPSDLAIGAITKREDPRDALVVKGNMVEKFKTLQSLPRGAVVGTSSLRRTAQLKRAHPHLKFADVRGNVGTRLAKLDNLESEYSAIVIAVAGLKRLGMSDRITQYLSGSNGGMLYAVGQGALALEIRQGDARVVELLSRVGHDRTTRQGLAERSVMRTLEGGCSVPIGVETEWVSRKSSLTSNVGTGVGIGVKPAEDYHHFTGVAEKANGGTDGNSESDLSDEMIMRGIVISLDGQDAAQVEFRRTVVTPEDANQFGSDVAQALIQQGADRILKQIAIDRGS